MKRYVLDSYALLAYMEGEKGARAVANIFHSAIDGSAEIYLSIINWGEVYYISLREGGKEQAELYMSILQNYPMTKVDADEELTMIAAEFKTHHRMSYADAFAAALAKVKKAQLVTGDKEFQSLHQHIKILWI